MIFIKTADNKKISLNHYSKNNGKVIIVAPGFFNNKDTVLFKSISEMFFKKYDVITFDFRGHGKSSGRFTWTVNEDKDLSAVINFAKEKGYKKIGVTGFSLGAAITLIEASKNKDINSIIAVSTPLNFWKLDCHVWEPEMFSDLKLNFGIKGKGKGVRPGNPFCKKTNPIDIIEAVEPIPVLFVHGNFDWLVKPYHSRQLFEKYKGKKELKIIDKAGHAEKIFDKFPEEFSNICISWFERTL